ncbi:PBS lyase heat domain protein repeat-containing protein [Azospirillaceae bacterium]
MGLVKTRRKLDAPDTESSPPDLESLIAQLEDLSADERRHAVHRLAQRPNTGELLCERLAMETDASVIQSILTVLMGNSDPAIVQFMISLLRSEDAVLRNGAVSVLHTVPEAVASHVIDLLADPDPDVRLMTVSLLLDLSHPHVAAWLTELVERETNVNVCAAALDGLAEVGGPDAVPAVHAALKRFSTEPYLVFVAETVLKRIDRK